MNQPVEYAPSPIALPSRLGQATAVEQSRAVAEVQAAVVIARQFPRSTPRSIEAMETACAQKELAEKAFYRYKRAGSWVEGPTIQLARALALCWGNVEYGVAELHRDDVEALSEMKAWAWDLESNTRPSSTFIVPHKRDTSDGVKDLVDMRSIYESNANNGARRLREQIFAVLPAWYTQKAQKLCRETLDRGASETPLAEQITDAVKRFEANGVDRARLVEKLGKPSEDWTLHDVVTLQSIYRSIASGGAQADEEFPPRRVTAEEIKATAKQAPANGQADSGAWPNVDPIPGAAS